MVSSNWLVLRINKSSCVHLNWFILFSVCCTGKSINKPDLLFKLIDELCGVGSCGICLTLIDLWVVKEHDRILFGLSGSYLAMRQFPSTEIQPFHVRCCHSFLNKSHTQISTLKIVKNLVCQFAFETAVFLCCSDINQEQNSLYFILYFYLKRKSSSGSKGVAWLHMVTSVYILNFWYVLQFINIFYWIYNNLIWFPRH